MRKLFVLLFGWLIFFRPAVCFAASDYLIKNFTSEITLNQDTSLTVREKIKVDFSQRSHGIYRVIPIIYSAGGKTIRAKFRALSVTDEKSQPVPFQTKRYNQSIKLKIGDSGKTIIGNQLYVITYQIKRVVLSYKTHDEIYWNVTGSEWGTEIESASAQVKSDFARITKTNCFGCQTEFTDNQAKFVATQSVGRGRDFTIVVGLDKNNQLKFPGILARIMQTVTGNWGYLIAFLPVVIMFLAWYKKGRDKRYLSDNIYYQPKNQKKRRVSVFARPHLPLVYHPIDNLTPAQVGTIIDEKVDMQDVVAEIVELARLGYLRIKKIKKKKIFFNETDYQFEKTRKNKAKLKEYQKLILNGIFAQKDIVGLSELKNKFYKHLTGIKKKLYRNLVDQKMFPASPDTVRAIWWGVASALAIFSFFLAQVFVGLTANSGPLVICIPASIFALIIPKFMPRKTAWGYSLHRQAKGLQWYLGKGKWREEIAEKHLFLEEMLPLAIALGVVGKLAKDMAGLGIEPPSYLSGIAINALAADLTSFQAMAASNLNASPSGRSSWSGGSGFSGGGSGGGFGGGGGGRW